MSNKIQLSEQRKNTIINNKSKPQELELNKAIDHVLEILRQELHVIIIKEKQVKLKDIVEKLRKEYPEQSFNYHSEKSNMSPDGGIVYLVDKFGRKYPILITEVKNQGTNDRLIAEGKKPQPKGNAVERLAKNVIGFRTMLLNESIFPFVCFGYGDDFKDKSTILDRVSTISLYGELNKIYLHNEGVFNRGSYFFREKIWSFEEMANVFYEVAKGSIYYYFSKYGEEIYRQK